MSIQPKDIAALSSVPAGHKLVPMEHTEAMSEAMKIEGGSDPDDEASCVGHAWVREAMYAAAIAAAPAIDTPAPAGGEEAVAWRWRYGPDSAWRLTRENPRIGCYDKLEHEPLYTHPAPDHHLRVEIERLTKERDDFRNELISALYERTAAEAARDEATGLLAQSCEMAKPDKARVAQLVEALRLHIVYEATPTDRGGKTGPKGRAWTAFIEARDAALADARAALATKETVEEKS